jgi:hypothetical protein
VAGTQESFVHGFASLQESGVPPWQRPAASQVSAPLHRLASLHEVPAPTGVLTHPEAGLHESLVHGLLSLQFLGAPVHAPLWHESPVVQALPSLQLDPLLRLTKTQPLTGLQLSMVHGLLSLQTTGAPRTQAPAPSQWPTW